MKTLLTYIWVVVVIMAVLSLAYVIPLVGDVIKWLRPHTESHPYFTCAVFTLLLAALVTYFIRLVSVK